MASQWVNYWPPWQSNPSSSLSAFTSPVEDTLYFEAQVGTRTEPYEHMPVLYWAQMVTTCSPPIWDKGRQLPHLAVSDALLVVSLPICAWSIWVCNCIPIVMLADSLESPQSEWTQNPSTHLVQDATHSAQEMPFRNQRQNDKKLLWSILVTKTNTKVKNREV